MAGDCGAGEAFPESGICEGIEPPGGPYCIIGRIEACC